MFLFGVRRPAHCVILSRGFAKRVKAAKGVAAVTKSKELPVETDVEKLVNYCCINYHVGEQPIPLKPDSEYPDWLWSLRTDRRPPPISELDRNSYYFWRRIRTANLRKWNRLSALDGWFRKDHRSTEDHRTRFLGDWVAITDDWIKQKQQITSKDTLD